MARIASIKELQAICDDLYAYFVERLVQVTEIETKSVDGVCHSFTEILLHVVKTEHCDNCLKIIKWDDGQLWFCADDYNSLMIGTISDLNAIEIATGSNLGWKRYTNKKRSKNSRFEKACNS